MKGVLTVKRLLAGMLGAAMLFTAVGVAGPMEAKAATQSKDITYNLATNIPYDPSAGGNMPGGETIHYPEISVGDYIVFRFTNNSSDGGGISFQYQSSQFNSNSVMNFSQWPDRANKGETKEYWFIAQHAGNYRIELRTSVRVDLGSGTTGNYTYYLEGNVSAASGTTPGSTGSGTTTPGMTTGGATPGTGTIPGTGTSTDTKPATEKNEPSIPVHTHSYSWEVLHEATEEHDGEMADICSVCGDIRQRVPITGFYLFQKETMDKVRAAAPNATVEVKTSKWISFHRMVMNALAERQDVTLKVSFLEGEYRGARRTLTIPAGTDTNALLNEDGYAGFKYLGGMFGLE